MVLMVALNAFMYTFIASLYCPIDCVYVTNILFLSYRCHISII